MLPSAISRKLSALRRWERSLRFLWGGSRWVAVVLVLLALAIGVVGLPFPFLPRHLTLIGSLTIGIPAFFLALAPSAERARPGFVSRVLRFAVPAGTLAAAATFSAYYLASGQPGVTLTQATTTATLVLAAIGLRILSLIARPLVGWKKALLAAVAAAFLMVLAVPELRDFFALEIPPPIVFLAALGILGVVELAFRGAEAVVGFAVQRRTRRPAKLR